MGTLRRTTIAYVAGLVLLACQPLSAQQASSSGAMPYLHLGTPHRILPDAQAWEGNEFPHTMSILEFKHDGYRYWGWYGLNMGGGIGLARSNDLVHWTKFEKNPLWKNARWPSVLSVKDHHHSQLLYFAITRNYDTSSSYIVLATSRDGIHLVQKKTLVSAVPNQRNQNPNLFRDPQTGRYYLTFYRGNDNDHFEIVSKSAASIDDLDKAPEKVLLKSTTTVAAPTLLYVKHAPNQSRKQNGVYYLATEIYPARYTNDPGSEWQVEVFASDAPDGEFKPVAGNPVMKGQRACLFQNIFRGRFYGFDCHLVSPEHWVLEEVEAPLQ